VLPTEKCLITLIFQQVEGDEYSHVHPSAQSDMEEYDSLGSDSEGRVEDKPVRFQSEYLRSNIRHSKLLALYK
jgi:hypothetical protein